MTAASESLGRCWRVIIKDYVVGARVTYPLPVRIYVPLNNIDSLNSLQKCGALVKLVLTSHVSVIYDLCYTHTAYRSL